MMFPCRSLLFVNTIHRNDSRESSAKKPVSMLAQRCRQNLAPLRLRMCIDERV